MFSPSSIITGGLGSWGDIGSVITLGYGSGVYVPPEPSPLIGEGFGNWYGKDKKTRIRFVKKLTKELKQIEKKLEVIQAKKEAPVKVITELEILENLVYEDLKKVFDEEVKQTISAIDKVKTEKILLDIQSKIQAKQAKQAQLAEEQDIVFAIMTLM